MEINKEISIIVPIYNVEKYLSRCIESVLSQNFTEYELILVDDGSPDGCGDICEEYARKYPNKVKVIHKKNEGLPAARKSGFDISCGRYIMHLDSDDYLLPNAIKVLYNKAIEGKYDIVKGCNRRFTLDDSYEIEIPIKCNQEIIGPENYIKSLIRHQIKTYMWGGIYRRELFEDCPYCFINEVSVAEDWVTNLAIWRKVHKYISIPDIVYAYYINPKSMMQSKVLSHQYINKIGNIMFAMTKGASNEIHHLIELNRTISHIRTFFIPEIKWNSQEYKKIKEFIFNDNNIREIIPYIDKRYLYFIPYKSLFYVYSRLYSIIFKYLRLKGHTRNIL